MLDRGQGVLWGPKNILVPEFVPFDIPIKIGTYFVWHMNNILPRYRYRYNFMKRIMKEDILLYLPKAKVPAALLWKYEPTEAYTSKDFIFSSSRVFPYIPNSSACRCREIWGWNFKRSASLRVDSRFSVATRTNLKSWNDQQGKSLENMDGTYWINRNTQRFDRPWIQRNYWKYV